MPDTRKPSAYWLRRPGSAFGTESFRSAHRRPTARTDPLVLAHGDTPAPARQFGRFSQFQYRRPVVPRRSRPESRVRPGTASGWFQTFWSQAGAPPAEPAEPRRHDLEQHAGSLASATGREPFGQLGVDARGRSSRLTRQDGIRSDQRPRPHGLRLHTRVRVVLDESSSFFHRASTAEKRARIQNACSPSGDAEFFLAQRLAQLCLRPPQRPRPSIASGPRCARGNDRSEAGIHRPGSPGRGRDEESCRGRSRVMR